MPRRKIHIPEAVEKEFLLAACDVIGDKYIDSLQAEYIVNKLRNAYVKGYRAGKKEQKGKFLRLWLKSNTKH